MICLNCKKQIPDDADRCPHCGTEVFHKQQLIRELSFRRYQRWIFYGLFVILFVGMVGIVVKVYSINNKLLAEMVTAKKTIIDKETEATTAKTDLSRKTQELNEVKNKLENEKAELTGNLTSREQELAGKISELEKTVNEKLAISSSFNQLESALKSLAGAAVGIGNADLSKIAAVETPSSGADTDGDGLSDQLEAALGISATSTDTDGDGFNDKTEFYGGFDPLVPGGKQPLDQGFADKQKGRLFKQSWGGGYLWYVGLDGKRYFLGLF